MNKEKYRELMLAKRKFLSALEVSQKSNDILQNLIKTNYYKNANLIMTYVSTNNEVATWNLIDRIYKDNKHVAVPFCLTVSRDLLACEIKSTKELAPGTMGIHEPIETMQSRVDINKLDIVIIPGLAFDRKLSRLGHGAGYYDRFLRKLGESTLKIGLAYDFQLLDSLPIEKHDIKMDIVITENEIIRA